MKSTDYAPRSAAMDAHLRGQDLRGIEVGCDVGAHAEALLRYCAVSHLVVVDLWEKDFYRGYCMGRLQSHGWKNRTEFLQMTSHSAVQHFGDDTFDFVYIDILHDYATVKESLEDWWPKLKVGGVMGYRNYSPSNRELTRAVDEFIAQRQVEAKVESYHGEIVLFK